MMMIKLITAILLVLILIIIIIANMCILSGTYVLLSLLITIINHTGKGYVIGCEVEDELGDLLGTGVV